MATRRYMANPGEKAVNGGITQAAGAAIVTKGIELTIDLATSYDYDGLGNAKQMSKQEVLDAIEEIKTYITHGIWPPA